MESFGKLMFTEAVRAEQERVGSRRKYERAYAEPRFTEIGPDEQHFIETRTTAYIASVNSDGWPYVQHRGGPPGFLKVLSPEQIAFAEYPGNQQFLTIGNLETEHRVSVILMDYPQQARLKLLAKARVVTGDDAPAELVAPDGVAVTRAMVLDVVALDWNCPKYITRRFSEPELEALVGPRMREMAARIAELEGELAKKNG